MSKAEHMRNHRLQLRVDDSVTVDAFEYDSMFHMLLGLTPVKVGDKVLCACIHSIDIDCFFNGISNIPSTGLLAGTNQQHFYISEKVPNKGYSISDVFFEPTPQRTVWEDTDTISWGVTTDVPMVIPPIKRNWFHTDLDLVVTGTWYFVYNTIQIHEVPTPTDIAGYTHPRGNVVVNIQYTWKEFSMREFVAENMSKT